jgi:hypothetical protein
MQILYSMHISGAHIVVTAIGISDWDNPASGDGCIDRRSGSGRTDVRH